MKVSIVTVVYNNVNTILNTINSVNGQDYKNIEYIIIDGKSTDGTIEIINNNLDKVSRFISETDLGIYDAMNKGILLSTGDIIGILNSDDIYYDENVLSDVMPFFQEDQSLDAIYGNIVYVGNGNTDKIVRKWISKPFYSNFFEDANVPPHPSLFVRRSVYEKVGLFDLKYRLAADYEFMFRMFKKHYIKTIYIDRMIVKMRLGGATNKSFKNILQGNKEIHHAWKNNGFKVPFLLFPKRLYKRLTQFI